MRMNKHTGKRPCCRCYKFNNGSAIYCLGMISASSSVQTFSDRAQRAKFMWSHCYPPDESRRCAIYKELYMQNEGAPNGKKKDVS